MLENLRAKTDDRMKEAAVVVAVVVFLSFIGFNVFLRFFPRRWDVECLAKDSSGKVVSTVRAYPAEEDSFKRFIEEAEKRGEICTVTPSTKRYVSRKWLAP